MRARPFAFLAVLLAFLASDALHAGPGALDPTYGTAGIATTPGLAATALAIAPDGRLMGAGATTTSPARFAVARFAPSGALEPTFGTGGTATAGVGVGDAVATALAIQPDRRTLATGYAYGVGDDPTSNARVVLVRFDSEGRLDSAFGSDGMVTTAILPRASGMGESIVVGRLELLPDGKALVGGSAVSASGARSTFLIRYHPDGALDATFGDGGIVRIAPASPAHLDVTFGPLLLADGRMLLFGRLAQSPDPTRPAVVRFLSDGRVDASFGNAGASELPFAVTGALQLADKRLLITGAQSGPPSLRLARLTPDGTLDGSFGNGGMVVTPFGECRPPVSAQFDPCPTARTAVALQPDGQIVQTGAGIDNGDNVTAIARFHPDGSLDTTFGEGGRVAGRPAVDGKAVAIENDGLRIYVGGWPYFGDTRIARYLLATTPGAIALTSSANPAATGQGVTLTATVIGQSPTGSVTFRSNDSVITGCLGVPLGATTTAQATATCTVTLPVGSSELVAEYSGNSVNSPLVSAALIQSVGEVAGTLVVEFFNAGLGGYFISADRDEIAGLDAVPASGWQRTGQAFHAFANGVARTRPMCRYFSGVAFAPASSHFFSASLSECSAVPRPWIREGDVIPVALPAEDGSCVNGTTPLYRLYNNSMGGVPHHRYTTSAAVRASMLAAGWIGEGAGVGVMACVLA
jgi:uncharacterized delta-60 repeat protein